MLQFFKYLPAIVAIQSQVEALIQDAKADDGKVDHEESFHIALGTLIAVARVLFPQLGVDAQDRIEQALIGAGSARDKIADGYAVASEALTAADDAYNKISAVVNG